MEKKGIINFQAISQNRAVEPAQVTQSPAPIRIRASRILTRLSEIPIYGKLARILENLKWDTAKILIGSAKEKEDVVETVELTAPVGGIAGKTRELIVTPDSVQHWQDKGSVLITKRLPTEGDPNQVIPASNQTEKIKLIEEVGIFPDQSANLFLKAPADLKKAA